MTQKPLTEMTNEELQKNEKAMKTTAIIFGVCVGLIFLSGIYQTIRKGFSISSILPLAILPLFIINMQNWKKTKAEIARRG